MIDPREENKNNRRDKKIDKKKNGMRVSMAGKKLAEILLNKLRRNGQ